MNIFEKAARLKVRFLYRGQLACEDLFDLSLNELDELYKSHKKQDIDDSVDGLLTVQTRSSNILKLKLEIIKYIFDVKKVAAEKAKARTGIKMHNQKILELIDEKQNQEQSEKSIEELKSLIVDEDDGNDGLF
jgi:hypothetical protein